MLVFALKPDIKVTSYAAYSSKSCNAIDPAAAVRQYTIAIAMHHLLALLGGLI